MDDLLNKKMSLLAGICDGVDVISRAGEMRTNISVLGNVINKNDFDNTIRVAAETVKVLSAELDKLNK